jgi:RimJ/RimL family protein N-acetyltransferase
MTALTTKRLLLRPMTAEDEVPLLQVFADPRVMAAFDRGPFSAAEMHGWLARRLEHHARHGFGLYAVALRETSDVIGDCGLERMEIDSRPEVELGYDFRSDHWGRGLATEAAQACRDHGFDLLGCHRLVSLIAPGNLASRRVAEKVGMNLEKQIHKWGKNICVYAIDAPIE